jgi:hypothetical protein
METAAGKGRRRAAHDPAGARHAEPALNSGDPGDRQSLSEDGRANEAWIDNAALRFLSEFGWYAEALAAKRAIATPPY